MAKKDKKKKVLESLDAISKAYPGSIVASDIEVSPLWLPSRNIPLNYAMGGGIPYGKIAEFYGEESSGKTLAALDFAAATHALGGLVIWNDGEQSFTKNWAELNGLDVSRTFIYPETAVERVSDWLADMAIYCRKRLTNNEPILFVNDSLAALDCMDNINSSQTDAKAEMGNRAKAIYKMLRIRNQLLSELGVCSIFINQIRHKLGTTKWEDPDTTPGGRAMKFYAHQRMGFYSGKQIKEKVKGFDLRVGVNVSIRVKKNKVAPPRPTFRSQIFFNPDGSQTLGFHKYMGLLDILEQLEVVERRGSNIYYRDHRIASSEEKFYGVIQKNPELRGNLIKRSEINTLSRTRKKIEKTEGNLFSAKGATFTKHTETKTVPEDEEE